MFLPRFKNDDDFVELLVGFEGALPLKRPSNLHNSPELAVAILSRTHGITGKISLLLSAAAREAIASGEERVTLGIVESVPWMDEEAVQRHLRDL
jgi:hypothetical protein